MGRKLMGALCVLCMAGFLGLATGCDDLRPKVDAFPQDFQGLVKGAVDKVTDQGVLDTFVSNVEGDVINPGIEAYGGLLAVSGVYIRGMDGRVRLMSQGTGTQLPTAYRETLLSMLADPTVTDEMKAQIVEILGWNRVESPHNPVPSQPNP
jgi:hypothetical protein